MPQLGLILSLMLLAIIFSGVDACQKDVDFAKQSSVSPSASATDDDDDNTTGSPSPSGSNSPSPSASPSASPSPTASSSESETATPTETPTAVAPNRPNRYLRAEQNQNALKELQQHQEKVLHSRATAGKGASQAVSLENWLGQSYDEELIKGQAIDSDGDGYSDLLEKDFDTDYLDPESFPRVHVTNLFDRIGTTDEDLDGLSKKQEVVHGTSENNPDSDNDGVSDGAEVLSATNPNAEASRPIDSDGDGLSNDYEANHATNPHAIDTDDDGLPDDLEIAIGSNPLDNDTDKDGILDGREFFQGSDTTISEARR